MTERYVAASKDDLQQAAAVLEAKFGEHGTIETPVGPLDQTVVKTVVKVSNEKEVSGSKQADF
jgi:hypothetical protein